MPRPPKVEPSETEVLQWPISVISVLSALLSDLASYTAFDNATQDY